MILYQIYLFLRKTENTLLLGYIVIIKLIHNLIIMEELPLLNQN